MYFYSIPIGRETTVPDLLKGFQSSSKGSSASTFILVQLINGTTNTLLFFLDFSHFLFTKTPVPLVSSLDLRSPRRGFLTVIRLRCVYRFSKTFNEWIINLPFCYKTLLNLSRHGVCWHNKIYSRNQKEKDLDEIFKGNIG